MSGHRATRGDGWRLAADTGLDRDALVGVLQAMLDAGWTVTVLDGWRVRPGCCRVCGHRQGEHSYHDVPVCRACEAGKVHEFEAEVAS